MESIIQTGSSLLRNVTQLKVFLIDFYLLRRSCAGTHQNTRFTKSTYIAVYEDTS